MKNIFRNGSLASFLAVAMIFVACTKENSDTKLDAKLTTSQTENITSNSAKVVGFIIAQGDGITEKGICYGTATAPTVDNNKVIYTSDEGTSATFTVTITGLDYATKYYARAYAVTANGVIYGAEVTFTTLPIPATLTTAAVTAITANTATSGGDITNDGGAAVTKRGICFSVLHMPKAHYADSLTSDGEGSGAFVSALTKLRGNTTYYVRAYAINKADTAYGQEVSFTTLLDVPTVTTAAITNLSSTGASSGGNITYDGGAAVTARGICWSTSANPTLADNTTSDGTGIGEFTSAITGLTVSTTYHVRAYATNSVGTAYGNDIKFSTFPTALYMIGDGVGTWDWTTTDLPMIPVNSHPNLFWKIVWMNATGGFKMAPEKAWGNDFGKTGDAVGSVSDAAGAVYDKGGDNIPVPGNAGYYMVVVDFATGKIAITDPKVYLIGDVIGSWDTANPDGLFTVDNTNSVITITKTLANAEIRMYAWHPWFDQWWQSEFIILGGQIEFRGTGNDQTRVTVPAGTNQVDLNFITSAGSITQP